MRFRSGEELFQAAELFESQPLPRGRQIGIVSNSPSVATLAAEACATRGLHVSTASEAQNPLSLALGAGPPEYATAVRELVGDDGIDALLVAYVDRHGGDAEAVLEAIYRRLEAGVQTGCGVGRPLRWPVAGTNRTRRAELPVP